MIFQIQAKFETWCCARDFASITSSFDRRRFWNFLYAIQFSTKKQGQMGLVGLMYLIFKLKTGEANLS